MGYRVVLAEDSADIRDLLKLHLALDGRFEIVGESADGDEVLDLVERESPDVLISDMSLSGSSGLSLIEALRRGCPTCKIVVFSGFANTTREKIAQAGADVVMEKTVHTFEDVIAAAARLCDSSGGRGGI